MRNLLSYARFNGWRLAALILIALLFAPLISLFVISFAPAEPIFSHLWRTILPAQIKTTLYLMLGVGILSASIGTLAAWLTTRFDFMARKALTYALALPLALPTYIVAYAYGDVLDSASPAYQLWQTILPARFYPNFYSLGGAIILLSLVLYPYVYFTARLAFKRQSAQLIDTARVLGASPWRSFRTIALPLARPAIIAGVTLVLMETLNDIGAVSFLGVRTLTYGIYNTWLTRGSLTGAAQIALMLLSAIAILIVFERIMRKKRGFTSAFAHELPRQKLSGYKAYLAIIFCTIPVLFGFFVPVLLLLNHARGFTHDASLMTALGNSLFMATSAALATLCLALFFAHNARTGQKTDGYIARAASFGYAIPGTILGLGVLMSVAALARLIDGWHILLGSLAALGFAYIVRFLVMGINVLDAAYTHIPLSLDMAARSLGVKRARLFWRVHVSALKAPLCAATLLIFVETLKELPATLILRPFQFETLAISVYSYANLGQLEAAAAPACMIIFAGVIAVFISFHFQRD